MDVPDGYEMRPPRRADVEAIADVFVAGELDAFGAADSDANDITEDWAYGGFDVDEDSWVVTHQGRIVAYAAVFKKVPGEVLEAYGGVHPDHHGRGIGRLLLDLLEDRARRYLHEAGDEVMLQTYVIGRDERGKDLHRSRGYRVVRLDWSMSIDLTQPLKEFPAPEGVTVRPFTPGDERTVYGMMESAFADHWQYSPTSYETWHARVVETDSFDPELWLLAFDGDRMVGGALSSVRLGRGFVNDLGVLRDARRRGVGAYLLYRSFKLFKERGLEKGALFVDAQNPTGASRLYDRVGMHVAREYELYGKEIRRSP